MCECMRERVVCVCLFVCLYACVCERERERVRKIKEDENSWMCERKKISGHRSLLVIIACTFSA